MKILDRLKLFRAAKAAPITMAGPAPLNARQLRAEIETMGKQLGLSEENLSDVLSTCGFHMRELLGYHGSMKADVAKLSAPVAKTATAPAPAPKPTTTAPAPAKLPQDKPEAPAPLSTSGLHRRARVEAAIRAQTMAKPVAPQAPKQPEPAPAMSAAQVGALCDMLFGGGFSQTLSANVGPTEGRARLVKSLYFARLDVPALKPEFAKLATKHPLSPARGSDRSIAASRQIRVNGWLTTHGFEVTTE